ncbi:MAG: anthranilate synthase component I [Pseudochelatococcus sp.]|jgi:anthranilate synthase component 1|uniref:anthranilate synthase component I n=1 Tax=Pseudochelatococcus sp. TaxID=2020869 RepID=UPI003D91CD4C
MSDMLFSDAFRAAYDAGAPGVVSTTLVADLETPVAAFLKLRAIARGPSLLLESVEGGAARGRYSIIGLNPDIVWRCRDGAVAVERTDGAPQADPRPPLESLRALLAESRLDLPRGLPAMAAGVFGYLGYDMVRLMERLPAPPPDVLGVPDAVMVRPTLIAVFDSVTDALSLVTPVRPLPGVSARQAHEAAVARIEEAIAALDAPLPHDQPVDAAALAVPEPVSNTAPDDFRRMVARAKEYIKAGDIFQVVLSQRFDAPFSLPPLSLYRALRRSNPSPYLAFLDFNDFQVVCSSPEILVKVADGEVTVRPIAGTRRRGETPSADAALAAELLADPKERAEHLMLLDLGRNDVGRVSATGTVRVTDSFYLEYYSQVMHIVSNVVGRLDPKHDVIDALAAGFPAGTVSGAPKVRAMEIIDELEKHKRGPYAGCIGYFSAGGDMDTCIVLRTAIIRNGRMSVQAGAGIVHDSDPESELQECINKARAQFRAAEEAVRFAASAGRGQ